MNPIPRPEYPRMQFRREASWLNLNGDWRCRFDFGKTGVEREWQKKFDEFDRDIVVPFCPESKLSGIGHTDFIESMFYARKITVPASWSGKSVLLHFGAVEYAATAWIDGAEAGRHQGGSASFTLDITPLVKPGVEQTLAVHALDKLRDGCQGGGKQSTRAESYGCLYTRVTGIWQTVWLEAVHPAGIASCRIVPGVDAGVFGLAPRFRLDRRGYTFTAILLAEGKEENRVTVPAATGVPVTVPVPSPRLWNTADPFLYDFVFELRDETGKLLDRVESYAGLRKVHIEGNRVFLNNEPIFQRLVLDQGFYPDGIWTAPSDAALKRDIELSLEAGFNGARLHQKVFEERFHYWADKLGYLTWAEYPNWGMDWNRSEARYRYLEEWQEILARDVNHPSIVAWSPFNETAHPTPSFLAAVFEEAGSQERYRTFMRNVYDRTKSFDPSRPVNDSSGYLHVKTDLWTVHPYRANAADLKAAIRPKDSEVMIHAPEYECGYSGQPYLIDEWGGFKFIPESHRATTQAGWGYHGIDLKTPEELCAKIEEQADVMLADPGIVGYCYTQLTDVEQEENGVYCYDRTPKVPDGALKRIFGKKPDWDKTR